MTKPKSILEVGEDETPSDPRRVRAFAKFFKNYMSVSAVVAAALPIPVTSFKLIPTYTAQTSILSTYTSLFCFLTLGFIFYSRHQVGRLMFPQFLDTTRFHNRTEYRLRQLTRSFVAFLPALLIGCSLLCVYYYHWLLNITLDMRAQHAPEALKASALLTQPEIYQIPEGNILMFWYLGIFVFAEAAFVLMAMKEYIQDLVRLSEAQLILSPDRQEKRQED